MPSIGKAIKNRIKSVSNTKKITKAMELVAAAKMRKAIASSLSSKLYAQHAWELLQNLSKEKNLKHPLVAKQKNNKELLIVVASNKGLCGGYNANINKATNEYINTNKNKTIDLIVTGKKAENIAKRLNNKTIASFIEFSENITSNEITGLSKIVIDTYTNKEYSKISIIFTDFISNINYQTRVKPILPITKDSISELIKENTEKIIKTNFKQIILFEPNEEEVLQTVLPRLTEVQIYQALLEATASEHSARMMAMKNAGDNAEDMLQGLKLFYNQTRQASITQEIAEISSGAEALS